MEKKLHKKGTILLLVILTIIFAATGVFYFLLKTDVVEESIKNETFLNVLFVVEDKEKPLASYVMIYYPAKNDGAVFNIPENLGIILKTADRFDRIDSVYAEKGIDSYKREIELLTGISEIPFVVSIDLENFAGAADMLGGIPVFVAEPIESLEGETPCLLPSGLINLDGDKILSYMRFKDDGGEEMIRERQKSVLHSFLGLLNSEADKIFNKNFFPQFEKNFKTNVPSKDFRSLLTQISKVGAEKLTINYISGEPREIDGKKLLLPLYEGQLIKDVFQQTSAALASDNNALFDRVYDLEIQNGTETQNLARNTATTLRNFGYDVVNIRNAEKNDYEQTIIIDHIGNQEAAEALGKIIRCTKIQTDEVIERENGQSYLVDFTIILGKDFDGRYVTSR